MTLTSFLDSAVAKNVIKFFLKKTPISHSNLVFEDAEFNKFYKSYFESLKKPKTYLSVFHLETLMLLVRKQHKYF